MGKLFVRIGLMIQRFWHKFKCGWNLGLSKLVLNVDVCPNRDCTCKK